MNILFQPAILLGCFVLLKSCQFIFNLMTVEEHFLVTSLRATTLVLWGWLALNAVKGQRAMMWILTLVLALHAVGLFFGFFAISGEQPLLKGGALLAGIYFAAGSVALGNRALR